MNLKKRSYFFKRLLSFRNGRKIL